MSRTHRRVRASDLAEMGYCEQKCLLKALHGDQSTPAADRARRGGQAAHEQFHDQVTRLHDAAVRSNTQPQDRRCFVASAVYGADDVRTQQLRSFRDITLLPRWYGPGVVKLYYAISPPLAWIASRHPLIKRLAERMLDTIRHRIVPLNAREACHGVEQHAPQCPHRGH